jgi:uncharacterized membrane protein
VATLTVWKFDDPDTAASVRERLLTLQSRQSITIHDAVVVSWPEGKRQPRTHQLASTAGAATAGGAFWGLLLGLIFFAPLFGMAFGAAMGAVSGSLDDFGIADDFVADVRERVTPGTSALFLLSSDAIRDLLRAGLGDVAGELIATNLGVDDEAAVRELFRD